MSVLTDQDYRIPAAQADLLTRPSAYADGSIFNVYKWLRSNQPLGVAEVEGFDPFWVVTRHADIMEISRQNDLFCNGDRSPTLVTRAADRRIRDMMGGSPHLIRSLIHMDPPDHRKYRTLTQRWFMPANLKSLEAGIREIARAAVERMAATGGRCDFVNAIALHYPLHVVMSILGVPQEDEALMLKLTQEMFGATDPETPGTRATTLSLHKDDRQLDLTAFNTMANYFRALSEERRRNPTDDLASVIANAQIDGEPIPELATMGYYILVATAGHDTTSSSTAGAVWALAENPDEFRKVKADPSLIPHMLEEAIRVTTPVKTFMRTATADVEFAGRPIRKGDWLMLCYASGNRDEAVFDEPDAFRVDRNPNRQIAFGHGGHMCLGMHLARMEMRILFEELLPRLESLELDGRPAMSQAVFVNGPTRLPVRFTMR